MPSGSRSRPPANLKVFPYTLPPPRLPTAVSIRRWRSLERSPPRHGSARKWIQGTPVPLRLQPHPSPILPGAPVGPVRNLREEAPQETAPSSRSVHEHRVLGVCSAAGGTRLASCSQTRSRKSCQGLFGPCCLCRRSCRVRPEKLSRPSVHPFGTSRAHHEGHQCTAPLLRTRGKSTNGPRKQGGRRQNRSRQRGGPRYQALLVELASEHEEFGTGGKGLLSDWRLNRASPR